MQVISFLVPYPIDKVASQRFRFEQYQDILTKRGISFAFLPFFSIKAYNIVQKSDSAFLKNITILFALIKRWLLLSRLITSEFIFIHREAMPIGPPIFEWVISKILRKKIIYDFDDAIWLTDKLDESKAEQALRWRKKVKSICKWSYKISCGNEYLAKYARRFNPNTIVNPTTIDTVHLHNPSRYTSSSQRNHLNIGWTGSHSTLKYLMGIESSICHLQEKYSHINLLIIADQKPNLNVKRLEFIPWSKSTESEDLLQIDIGIMPLPDDEWTKGKCGFKALQYMAMEKPTVVSAVGVNTTIVDHGINGYLVYRPDEWITYLEKLILDKTLRAQMGKSGRLKVINHYSIASNTSTFLSLFE
jgi:glycosyltransferase involved in cell wall biosynthesis